MSLDGLEGNKPSSSLAWIPAQILNLVDQNTSNKFAISVLCVDADALASTS
eukprot:SAG31_NODE_32574_length_354_cov_0.698039_1_plen_50_part_10